MRNIERVRFTFKDAGWATLPPGTAFGPRKMAFYQWLWIQEGFCEGEWDGQRQDLPPGSMVFIRPGMTDRYRWDPKRKTRAAYLHFQMSLRGARLPAMNKWPIVRPLPEGDIIRPLFCHIAWLMEHGGGRLPGAWRKVPRGNC